MKRLLLSVAIGFIGYAVAMHNTSDFSTTRKLLVQYNKLGYQEWLHKKNCAHSSAYLMRFISELVHDELQDVDARIGRIKLGLDDRHCDQQVACDATDAAFEEHVANPLKIAEIGLRFINRKIEQLKLLKKDVEIEAKLRSKL